MNLILLSDPSVDEGDNTVSAVASVLKSGRVAKIAYVPAQADRSRGYFRATKEYYRRLGVDALEYFDLDEEYDGSRTAALLESGAIHLSGGSTYHFLENMRRRNFPPLLRDYAAAGGILIGVSAGAILMTPRINASVLCGDPVIPGLETGALGLVDWEFVPHVDPGSAMEAEVIAYSEKTDRKVLACSDGDGILLESGKTRYLGGIREYHRGILQIRTG